MIADGKPLRVIETIAAGNYRMFGMTSQDKNLLAQEKLIHDGAECVTEVLQLMTSDQSL